MICQRFTRASSTAIQTDLTALDCPAQQIQARADVLLDTCHQPEVSQHGQLGNRSMGILRSSFVTSIGTHSEAARLQSSLVYNERGKLDGWMYGSSSAIVTHTSFLYPGDVTSVFSSLSALSPSTKHDPFLFPLPQHVGVTV